jgi:hypothetical protein
MLSSPIQDQTPDIFPARYNYPSSKKSHLSYPDRENYPTKEKLSRILNFDTRAGARNKARSAHAHFELVALESIPYTCPLRPSIVFHVLDVCAHMHVCVCVCVCVCV